MKKVKVGVQRSGSLFWLIFWLVIFLPIGLLYWLFRYKKIKVYEYKEDNKE